jgi:hypothetical protein
MTSKGRVGRRGIRALPSHRVCMYSPRVGFPTLDASFFRQPSHSDPYPLAGGDRGGFGFRKRWGRAARLGLRQIIQCTSPRQHQSRIILRSNVWDCGLLELIKAAVSLSVKVEVHDPDMGSRGGPGAEEGLRTAAE